MKKEIVSIILDRSEELQQDMFDFMDDVRKTKKGKKMSYETMLEMYYLIKIAELELKIKSLADEYHQRMRITPTFS